MMYFTNLPRRMTLLAGFSVPAVLCGLLALPTTGLAQNQVDEVSFKLVPNLKVIDCLRRAPWEEPRATATVTRGNLNDTLILDVEGIKPGLAFDLFTVQRSSLLADGSADPGFKNFGLAWYQSDVQIGKYSDGRACPNQNHSARPDLRI